MHTRPICPESSMPTELDECIYRCFEAHRRRVLQRRAARQQNRQQSQPDQQNQTLPIVTAQTNSNLTENTFQYNIPSQSLNEAVQVEDYQQDTFDYNRFVQSSTLPKQSYHQIETTNAPILYYQPSEVQYISQQFSLPFADSTEQRQTTTTSEASENNHDTTTQTVTDEEGPGKNQETASKESHHESKPAEDHALEKPADVSSAETSDQKSDAGQQAPIESPSPNKSQQDISETVSAAETRDTPEQLENTKAYNSVDDRKLFASTEASTSLPPNDRQDDEDDDEDEEIFDLRTCICRCYAKFKEEWIKDEQKRYEQQFSQFDEIVCLDESTQTEPIHCTSLVPIPATTLVNITEYPKAEEIVDYAPAITETHRVVRTPPNEASIGTYDHIEPEREVDYELVKPQKKLLCFELLHDEPLVLSRVPTPPPQPTTTTVYLPTPPPLQPTVPVPLCIPPPQPTTTTVYLPTPPPLQPTVPAPLCIPPPQPTTTTVYLPTPPPLQPTVPAPLCIPPPQPTTTTVYLPTPPPQPTVPVPLSTPPPSTKTIIKTPVVVQKTVPVPIIQPVPTIPTQPFCVQCCCVPGRSLIKKVVNRPLEDNKYVEQLYVDYGSVIDQLETRITVRHGNDFMGIESAFACDNYTEKLQVLDFPVYVSGEGNFDMRQLVPNI